MCPQQQRFISTCRGEFEKEPNGGEITKCFEQKTQLLDRAKQAQTPPEESRQQAKGGTGWKWW
jgi:hypothetical protein